MSDIAAYDWKSYSQSITIEPPRWPETITPPHDRRHRWRMTSERTDALGWPTRRWFRCTACGRRTSMRHLASLLSHKMEQARASLDRYMTTEVWDRLGRGERLSDG